MNKKYKSYLLSARWKSKRQEALEFYGPVCENCQNWGNDIHHISYKNLRCEPMKDLMVLCRGCHDSFHAMPGKERQKREQRLREEKKKSKPDKVKINKVERQAVFRKMSKLQIKETAAKFSISENQLNIALGFNNDKLSLEILDYCLRLLKGRYVI